MKGKSDHGHEGYQIEHIYSNLIWKSTAKSLDKLMVVFFPCFRQDTWRNHDGTGVGWDEELLKEEAIQELDEEIQLEVDQVARVELARLKSVCYVHHFDRWTIAELF